MFIHENTVGMRKYFQPIGSFFTAKCANASTNGMTDQSIMYLTWRYCSVKMNDIEHLVQFAEHLV